MKAIQQFNGLNGAKVSKTEIEKIIDLAKTENNTDIVYRLSKILNENPEYTRFEIEVNQYQTSLNSPQHTGSYKEALDDCGRLQKGWKFANGTVVKVLPKAIKKIDAPTSNNNRNTPKRKRGIIISEKKPVATNNNNRNTLERKRGIVISEKKPVATNDIVGYMLIDNITGEIVASKKTLELLKTAFHNLSPHKDFKDMETLVYEIIYKNGKNGKGNKVEVNWNSNNNADSNQVELFSIEKKLAPTSNNNRNTPKRKREIVISEKKPVATNDIVEMQLSQIFTDKNRFQNRTKLDQNIIKNIVENFDKTQFDPIIIWYDAKQKKYFVLAGHHRFEALKLLGKKTAPVKIANYTEEKATQYAKVESNANRTLELPQERAKIYKEKLKKSSLKEVLEQAKKLEGKNANYIVNLAHLSEKGLVMQVLNQLSETPDKQNATITEKLADWIGEARRNNTDLTDAHEKEMFDFLQNKETSKRINTKAEFLQKINSITNDLYFDKTKALNLKKFKYQSEGESVYDAEYKELKDKIDSIVANRLYLIDRIKNPSNKEYINPTEKDYGNILKALDTMVFKYDNDLKTAQQQLINLSRKKGYYTNAGSNQVGLFGTKGFRAIKLSAYTIASNCTNLTDAKDGFNEVNNAIRYYERYNKKIPTFFYLRSIKLGKRIKYFEEKGLKNPIINTALSLLPMLMQPTNSKITKIGLAGMDNESVFFKVSGQVGKFLQQVERKPFESVVITLDGMQGAGKTTTLYKFMNAFAETGNKCLFLSGEEHPASSLAKEKVQKHLNKEAQKNIDTVGEVANINELYHFIEPYDIIFIDSWQKLQRMVGNIRLDEDLRKKFNGKVFVVIFQQTTTGRTKGGAEVVFDGDIIIKMVKEPSFADNYAYFDKNRYTKIPIENIRYNIATGMVYNPNTTEPKQDNQFSFKIN